MHKQDVENATMTAGIGLPLAGWLGGAHLAQMPFTPFPDALRETIHQTLQNPICSGLMKPDTHLGENARQIEVSDDQATSFLFR